MSNWHPFTYRDLGYNKECSPAVELNHQCVHLVQKHLLPLWVLAHCGSIFTFWQPIFFRGSVTYFVSLCGLIQPDRVLIRPQEDGVLGMGTGGAAQPAGHYPPVEMRLLCVKGIWHINPLWSHGLHSWFLRYCVFSLYTVWICNKIRGCVWTPGQQLLSLSLLNKINS